MVGAIGGDIGIFGGLGIGGAMAVGGGAGPAATGILGGPAPPSFTVSISDAGSAAAAADGAQMRQMTLFGANDGGGLTVVVGGATNLAAAPAGVSVRVDFPSLDINAQVQPILGADALDELVAALLLALLSQQEKQGSA